MRIGYAPGGGCLRRWLTQLGYQLPTLLQAGLVTAVGYDAYTHRIVFPLEGNLYGRSLSAATPPHRFLPGAKGGLYCWEQVRRYPEVILVEGLFDYAVLWQAGFYNVTCHISTRISIGNCATVRDPSAPHCRTHGRTEIASPAARSQPAGAVRTQSQM
jgi:DNA primase